MSCCGGGRASGSASVPRTGVAAQPSNVRPTLAVFRYEGETSLVVVGRITGTTYRFVGRGSEVAVDIRDRLSLRDVPRVREVRVI